MSDARWSSTQAESPLEAALVAAMRADAAPQGSRERTVARLTGWAPLIAVMLFAKRTLACHAPWLHAGVGALAVGGAVASIAAVQQPSAQSQVEPPSGAVELEPPSGAVEPAQHRTPHESPAPARSGHASPFAGRSQPSPPLSLGAHHTAEPKAQSGSSAPRAQRVATPSTVPSAAAAGGAVSLMTTPARRARTPRSSEALEAEVAALYGVRSGLAAGLPSVALERLADYERAFPRGALRTEARVLRVNALLQSGERERAEALGQAMLRADPNGTHADRLRALLGRRDR